MKTKLKTLALLAFVILILFIISLLTGQSVCPVYKITGIPCPSCGMTRAWLQLLSGNLHQAFNFHPLFWFVPLLLGAYLLSGNYLSRRQVNIFYITTAIIFIIVWAVRLYLLFPNETPMQFDADAVLPGIFFFFKDNFF